MMVATVFMGTFNAADIFWYPSPDLGLDNILSLYRQVYAFPNHVQSIGVHHRWTPIDHLKDDQWKQDAPELNFESLNKGSEYLFK